MPPRYTRHVGQAINVLPAVELHGHVHEAETPEMHHVLGPAAHDTRAVAAEHASRGGSGKGPLFVLGGVALFFAFRKRRARR